MFEALIDALIDCLKIIPFLFVAFLIIEIIEHKISSKGKNAITKSGKFSVLIGGMLGIIPQCGFSVMATNLYVTRIISLGTLITIYLTTSDEMLPIMLSNNVDSKIIIKILLIKFLIGILSGFIIDFIFRKKREKVNYEICTHEHCNCKDGNILFSSIIHTLKTILFIFVISFILNIIMDNINSEILSKLFLKDHIFAPFITCLIGLIPNCGASIVLTELYLNNMINLSSVISGLLTGSGVAILVLLKSNIKLKEKIGIVSLIYGIGVTSGILIQILGGIL